MLHVEQLTICLSNARILLFGASVTLGKVTRAMMTADVEKLIASKPECRNRSDCVLHMEPLRQATAQQSVCISKCSSVVQRLPPAQQFRP
jgi:hypothetical protein